MSQIVERVLMSKKSKLVNFEDVEEDISDSENSDNNVGEDSFDIDFEEWADDEEAALEEE
jgi:hypothetical protein